LGGFFYCQPCLRLQLNQLEIDIARLQIGDSHDGIDGDARHLFVALVDDLGAEGRLRCAHQVVGVVNREGVGDSIQVPIGVRINFLIIIFLLFFPSVRSVVNFG
jgi:hypothetical protein